MRRSDPRADANEALRAFVDDVLGGGWRAQDRSRTFGRRSVVWRIRAADGEGFYLKRHEERALLDRTLEAHRAWIPRIDGGAVFEVPELVATSEPLGALLMTELEGDIVDEAALSAGDDLRAYELAGRFAALLHAVPLASPPEASWSSTWQRRASQYLAGAEDSLDVQTLAWAWALVQPEASETEPAWVPTHADLSPRNWLIRREAGRLVLGVIDWERARPSIWVEDVQRMVYDHWHRAPARRDAWLEGYGRDPDARDTLWIRRFAVIHAIGGILWARERGDHEFVALNHEIIRRVRAEDLAG